jgi:predicted nucleic acid-binding protein
VGDASFWINLFATKKAEAFVRGWKTSLAITEIALEELDRGRSKGWSAAAEMEKLIASGLTEVAPLTQQDKKIFMSLVSGPTSQTLDDGEAATIVVAARRAGTALIDERKATSLAAARFPKLMLCSTIDLLLDPLSIELLGEDQIADAIFNALTGARMRVPAHRMEEVLHFLGPTRIAKCQSLPERYRLQFLSRMS